MQGAVGAAGSALRTGLGASLSFLVSKAFLLLQLIKRLALMAIEALKGLARRLRELAASAQRPERDASGEEENAHGLDRGNGQT